MLHPRPSFVALLVLAAACSDASPSGPGEPSPQAATPTLDLSHLANYANPDWPAHYDDRALAYDNTPHANPVTDRGATLGRVLFFDRRLSTNDRVSCASCHQAGQGFTDSRRFSVGVDGASHTVHHAMRLANSRFYSPGRAFWDRSLASLEDQPIHPIQDAAEMGFDDAHGGLDSLLAKMRGLSYYPDLFTFAFGSPAITAERMQQAIAQFVRSMISTDSRFDRAFAQAFNPMLPDRGITAPFPGLTAQENRGKRLFFIAPPSGGAGCGSCHTAPTFALTGGSQGNGLDADDPPVFKAPSLKNVAITGPYMHDGRFATLGEVIDHYDSGVKLSATLDYRLRAPEGGPQRLHLTAQDKADLIAFLRTLTDRTMLSDPKFSDPFTQ
jgi:cytochrome c peroxidase